MILAGYGTILGYIFLLIFGMGPLVQKLTNQETARKAIHIMLFAVWILLDVFFKDTVHQIIIPVIFIILNLLSYRFNIYKSVERDEGNHLGTVYFAVVVTAIMTFVYFLPQYYYCSGIAVFCLTFGDGFAALVGYNMRSPALRQGKSLAGFLACWVASAVSVGIFPLVYPVTLTVWQVAAIGAVAAILELCEYGLDNFTVSLGAFALCAALGTERADSVTVAVLVAVAVFLPVFLSKSIDYYGSLFAMGMVFFFCYFGGAGALVILLCAYGFISVISVFKKKALGYKKPHGRRFLQILINGGFGTLGMLAYGIMGHPGLLTVSIVAVGGCFVDSVASDVGVLSRKKPYDPLRRREVPAGVSGGVSRLGSLTSLAAAAAIAVAMWQCYGLRTVDIAILTGLMYGQCVLDTVLGSLVQVKYSCPECGCLTEKKSHCDKKTDYHSGVKWIDNNTVNFLSSLVITALALGIYWR